MSILEATGCYTGITWRKKLRFWCLHDLLFDLPSSVLRTVLTTPRSLLPPSPSVPLVKNIIFLSLYSSHCFSLVLCTSEGGEDAGPLKQTLPFSPEKLLGIMFIRRFGEIMLQFPMDTGTTDMPTLPSYTSTIPAENLP